MNFRNKTKNRGITIIEVLSVITIMAILAAISVPSFRGWIDRETYDRQVSVIFDSINEARAGMLSEKNCPSGSAAEAWGLKITNSNFFVWCRPIQGIDEVVTFNDQNVNDYSFDSRIASPTYATNNEPAFGNLVSATDLYIEFLIGTKQVRINNSFFNRSAQIQLDYLFLEGVENTICLDRYSQFSFFSPSGTCSEL